MSGLLADISVSFPRGAIPAPPLRWAPLHLHLVQFRVLDRDGVPPAPAESGWKDTVYIVPGETVRIQAAFRVPRKYLYHCHVQDHAGSGMMAVFETVA